MRLLHLPLTLALFASLCITVGCGDDDPPPPPPPEDAGVDVDEDSGNDEDTGTEEDAGTDADSGTGEDTGTDGDTPDGDPDADDTGVDGGVMVECDVELRESIYSDEGIARRIPLISSGRDFMLTWHENAGPIGNIFVKTIGPSGGDIEDDPIQITDAFATQRDPALVPFPGGALLAWHSNADGNFDIYTQVLDSAGEPSGDSLRFTQEGLREDSAQLVETDDGAVLTYFTDDGEGNRILYSNLVDGSGGASGDRNQLSESDDPWTSTGVVRLGDALALLYVENGGPDASNLRVQPMSLDGTLTNEPTTLSSEPLVTDGFSAVSVGGAGAVAYSIVIDGRDEVRFRGYDALGAPTTFDRLATPAPKTGIDPGLVPFAGGYAVAYRSLDTGFGEPGIELAFLDGDGIAVAHFPVSMASDNGGPVSLAINSEGSLMLAWMDVGDSATVEVARVECDL